MRSNNKQTIKYSSICMQPNFMFSTNEKYQQKKTRTDWDLNGKMQPNNDTKCTHTNTHLPNAAWIPTLIKPQNQTTTTNNKTMQQFCSHIYIYSSTTHLTHLVYI